MKFAAIIATVLMVSCARQDFSLKGPSDVGETPEDFSGHLNRHASRLDVELAAALGQNYQKGNRDEIQTVTRSLSHSGSFKGFPSHPFGNSVHRVRRCSEAEALLKNTWASDRFLPDSELSRLFLQYPNASVVMMDADDQQILFFNQRDILMGIYPPPAPR
jgi:hypothetical protein